VRSCLTAVYEEPSPHRTDKALDPVRDVHAYCWTLLVCRALTLAPDNAHQTPSGLFWGLRARMAGPGRVGRSGARPAGVPGNPPEPRDIRGATLWGGPGGNDRATMRSAVLTLASSLISCLHEPTTPQLNDGAWSQLRPCLRLRGRGQPLVP
jgi:hypothetical protein